MSEFIFAVKQSEIPDGTAKMVEVRGKNLAVFHQGRNYFAIDNDCTHLGGSISEGEREGNVVTCPWHGATFDISSGKALSGPASRDLTSYKVRVQGDDIEIEFP